MDELFENKRIEALSIYLECEPDDLNESRYNEAIIEYGSSEYLVVTDDEADEKAQEYITESLWAFNASFLSEFTGLPSEMFEALQPQCESANDAILRTIEQFGTIEDFTQEAISADGRGHFLSSYDGYENDITLNNGEKYYIYRVN